MGRVGVRLPSCLSVGLLVYFGSRLIFVPKSFPNVLPGVVVWQKGYFSYQVLFSYEGSDFSFHFLTDVRR